MVRAGAGQWHKDGATARAPVAQRKSTTALGGSYEATAPVGPATRKAPWQARRAALKAAAPAVGPEVSVRPPKVTVGWVDHSVMPVDFDEEELEEEAGWNSPFCGGTRQRLTRKCRVCAKSRQPPATPAPPPKKAKT